MQNYRRAERLSGVSDVLSNRVRDAGLTNVAIGQHLGLAPNAVSDRLRGRTRWSVEELPALAELLCMSVPQLFEDIK